MDWDAIKLSKTRIKTIINTKNIKIKL